MLCVDLTNAACGCPHKNEGPHRNADTGIHDFTEMQEQECVLPVGLFSYKEPESPHGQVKTCLGVLKGILRGRGSTCFVLHR